MRSRTRRRHAPIAPASTSITRNGNLCRALVDLLHRKESRRDSGPEAAFGEYADNEDPNDLERHALRPGRGDVGSPDVGYGAGDAGTWIVLLGIDGFHRRFDLTVKQRDKPLHLPLRVAEDSGPDLDLLSPRRQPSQLR